MSVSRFSRISGISIFLLSILGVAQATLAQVISNPNQISGVVELTNTNPDILAILNAPTDVPAGLNQGFSTLYINASSLNVSPAFTSNSSTNATSRTRAPYEITVEAGPEGDGIAYRMSLEMRLASGRERYWFSADSAPVEQEPSPDTVVDFSECAAILDVRWETAAGDPAPVTSGRINVYRQTGPSQFVLSAQNYSLAQGTTQEFLPFRGDGSTNRVDISYRTGDSCSPSYSYQTMITANCDEIVEVVTVVPDPEDAPPTLDPGSIVGLVDMLGEDENTVSSRTAMFSNSGPCGASSYDSVQGPPTASGPFEIEIPVPSDTISPPQGYRVYGDMSLRLGRRSEYFRTPFLGHGSNSRVTVPSGQTVDLGQTFVMAPGYVEGEIFFAGPPPSTFGSCLQDITHSATAGSNTVPSNWTITNSRLEASGINRLAAGATRTASGGLARVGFEGEYQLNSAGSAFEGDYELVLGGLLQESTVWHGPTLSLRFIDTATPQDAESYQNSSFFTRRVGNLELEIVPGQTQSVDYRRCFGQLNLGFLSTAGTFYQPRVTGSGGFTGIDFESNAANYDVVSVNAYGTPTSSTTAADTGLIAACLPEGTYTLNPSILAINPGGGSTRVNLPQATVNVGCGQVKDVIPPLQVDLEPLAACVDEPMVTVTGAAVSTTAVPVEVAEVSATINGSSPFSICSDCGENPSFDFDVELAECANQITVSAVHSSGTGSSTSVQTQFDIQPPVISGCQDLQLNLSEGEVGTEVDFDLLASDTCTGSHPVVCDHEPGSFFPAGTTEVTCTAFDTCNNSTDCSFTVQLVPASNICTGNTVYGVHDQGLSDSQIFRLDLDTGDATAIGPLHPGLDLESLEIHPETGALYTIASRQGGLYQVHKQTGELTLIGMIHNVRKHREISALAFAPDGVLWAYHKNIGLVTIDLEDATTTRQWYHSYEPGVLRKWDSLAWNPDGSVLYATQLRDLYRWDPVSHDEEIICGPGFLPGKTEALDYDRNGNLFAAWHEPEDSTLQIFAIDPVACTITASEYLTAYSDIEALAFESCD